MSALRVVGDDGGRAAAGYRGRTRDCAVRAAAIVLDLPYQQVADELLAEAKRERGRFRSSLSSGFKTATIARYLKAKGCVWTPTMSIGSGTTVHLRAGELPATGRHIVNCSKHVVALVDGVLRDTYDPCRGGTRAVYGYWTAR